MITKTILLPITYLICASLFFTLGYFSHQSGFVFTKTNQQMASISSISAVPQESNKISVYMVEDITTKKKQLVFESKITNTKKVLIDDAQFNDDFKILGNELFFTESCYYESEYAIGDANCVSKVNLDTGEITKVVNYHNKGYKGDSQNVTNIRLDLPSKKFIKYTENFSDYSFEIEVSNIDGSNAVKVPSQGKSQMYYSSKISTDGQKLVFIARLNGERVSFDGISGSIPAIGYNLYAVDLNKPTEVKLVDSVKESDGMNLGNFELNNSIFQYLNAETMSFYSYNFTTQQRTEQR
jgi:hypothetical protein